MINKGKVYIVDDDKAVTQTFEWLLTSVKLETQVFHDPCEFLNISHELSSGCILLDVRMPQLSGIEVLKILQKRKVFLPVIMVTAHGDIPMAVKAIKGGAVDFLTKPFSEYALLERIQSVLSEASHRTDLIETTTKIYSLYQSLTTREKQILKLIKEGVLNKRVASELNIAVSTVEMHRSKIMRKMEVKSFAELIKKSILIENLT